MIEQLTHALSDLKGSPALLAVVILQVATMTGIYFVSVNNAQHAAAREMALIEACKEGR